MYGSYGSYSSMCAMSAPMDITSSNLRAHDSTCAFPSWPRRDSLSDSDRREQRATSFLSDDDLLFLSDPFEDDARSISSAGSAASPAVDSPPRISPDAEMLADMERQRLAMQREYVRGIISEKERRRQQAAAKKQSLHRRSSPSSSGSHKKSSKSKLSAIVETGE